MSDGGVKYGCYPGLGAGLTCRAGIYGPYPEPVAVGLVMSEPKVPVDEAFLTSGKTGGGYFRKNPIQQRSFPPQATLTRHRSASTLVPATTPPAPSPTWVVARRNEMGDFRCTLLDHSMNFVLRVRPASSPVRGWRICSSQRSTRRTSRGIGCRLRDGVRRFPSVGAILRVGG